MIFVQGILTSTSKVRTQNVDISSNVSEYGGAFYVSCITVQLSNCNITNNTASLVGGGVYFLTKN